MKALVLCGGIPQIALIEDLKSRGIITALADMNENVAGRAYADEFYPVSVLDVEGIKNLADEIKADFVITVCADQVLQVSAQVSEMLGLPCYIDFETAENVSKKSYMKRIFFENDIPTSKYIILENPERDKIANLTYPLIVKPVDSYSSRGVKKVLNDKEMELAFEEARKISRTSTVVVEEYVEGEELSVDVYVENGKAHVLCMSNLDKIGGASTFVIHRTRYPADISGDIEAKIQDAAQKIAEGFGLQNTPMLIQLITDGNRISIVEFCARTGGGDKFRLIEKATGFDVVGAVADLTLGIKPHYTKLNEKQKYIVNEFVYCKNGVLDRFEGFEELVQAGIITEYFILKPQGYEFSEIKSSGDRAAYFTIETDSLSDLAEKHRLANEKIKALSVDGIDLIRHDLIENYEKIGERV